MESYMLWLQDAQAAVAETPSIGFSVDKAKEALEKHNVRYCQSDNWWSRYGC